MSKTPAQGYCRTSSVFRRTKRRTCDGTWWVLCFIGRFASLLPISFPLLYREGFALTLGAAGGLRSVSSRLGTEESGDLDRGQRRSRQDRRSMKDYDGVSHGYDYHGALRSRLLFTHMHMPVGCGEYSCHNNANACFLCDCAGREHLRSLTASLLALVELFISIFRICFFDLSFGRGIFASCYFG